jgi:CobQ-like glutamine amidotransferase family enzyme
LLPKNHRLADSLIVQALQRQGSPDISLEPLEDDLEAAAHRDALEAALSAR